MKENFEQKKLFLPAAVVEKIRKVFPDFDPEKLKAEDIGMWVMFKANRVNLDDFKEYSRSVLQAEGGPDASILKSSRLMFVNFLGNQMQNKLLREQGGKN